MCFSRFVLSTVASSAILISTLISADKCYAQGFKVRQWTDASGEFRINAKFLRKNGDDVVLMKTNQKTINVPIEKLSLQDKRYLETVDDLLHQHQINEYKRNEKSLLVARDILEYYNKEFDATRGKRINNWLANRLTLIEASAEQDALLIGEEYMTRAELASLTTQSDQMVDRWFELVSASRNDMTSPNFSEAQKSILIARRINPYSFRADFNLGLACAFVTRDYDKAAEHFENCIRRGRQYLPIMEDEEKSNFAAALNNMAITRARSSRLDDARRLWEEAMSIDPELESTVSHNIARTLVYIDRSTNNASFIQCGVRERKQLGLWAEQLAVNSGTRDWLYSPFVLSASDINDKIGRSDLNDDSCLICRTNRSIKCLNSNCRGGQVNEPKSVTIKLDSNTERTVWVENWVKCRACRGDEWIDCWGCVNGTQGF